MLTRRLLILTALIAATPVTALEVGAPVLETVTMTGQPAVICSGPALSQNGRYLTFNCLDSNIVPGDNNQRYDVFLRDRVTSAVERVSVDSNGLEQRFDSCCYTPADDGRVAFLSSGAFVPDVQPPPSGVGRSYNYLRDTNSGTTILISRSLQRTPAFHSSSNYVSFPPKLVVVVSDTDLITGQFQPFVRKGFIRNWETGAVEYIATAAPAALGECLSDESGYHRDGSCLDGKPGAGA